MSRDIRAFFSTTVVKKAAPIESPVTKRKAIKLSSDDDIVPDTLKERKQRKSKTSKPEKRRRIIIDSDDDDEKKITENKLSESPKSRKPKLNLSKLRDPPKIVKPSAEELEAKFGAEPKRVEKKKFPKQNKVEDLNDLLDDNDDFDCIIDLDAIELVENDKKKKSEKNITDAKQINSTPEKSEEQEKCIPTVRNSNKNKLELNNTSQEVNESQKNTPKVKKENKHDLDSSVLSDEERHERKRIAAILYQKYKNRSGALNPGSKEIPKGKPNCLSGLSFLVTGILESMERDESCNLIKDLGGKISSTVGKRLHYMVVGEEAGPKKLATAEDLGIKILNENQLFDLIREKSNNNTVKNENKSGAVKKKEQSPQKPSQIDVEKNSIDIDGKFKHHITKLSKTKNDQKKSPETRTFEKSPIKRKNENEEQITSKKEKILANKKTFEKSPTKRKKENEEPVASKKEIMLVSQKNSEGNLELLPWVDKYKPTNIKQIIGQQGAASNVVKLTNWLSKWYVNHDGKKKLQRPNPWAKNDDGSFYKAALLSGPPGVGKTTTASLVCKELGFDTVEFNASDTRSKRLLKEEVSELLTNKSLFGYFHGKSDKVSKKHVLIMDEVDGMAGNEDRGGIQELISLIKDSSVPIICMCNDRNHTKMRSLVNYCYDLRFNKPRLEQIKGLILSICFKEQMKLPPNKIEEMILATNNDIRQTLNHLSMLSAGKKLNLLDKSSNEKTANKDFKLGPWEVVRKVFSITDHKDMTFYDKSDLFFHDYSLGPLFVQQNYLQVLPSVKKDQIPAQVALAADSLSLGDLVDKKIRSNMAWSLLPIQAMFSSVLPGEFMEGHFVGQINFPQWLGKYSKSNKRSRLAQEIHDHTRIRTSGSRLSIRLGYAPFLLDAICRPLKSKGLDGLEEALNVIKEYRFLREDIDSLIELTSWPGSKNPMESVESKVKAALTRAYNKDVLAYSYSATTNIKRKKAEVELLGEFEGEAEIVETNTASDEDGEEDKLENDALIKAKKKAPSKASTSKTIASKEPNPKKSTSRASKAKK